MSLRDRILERETNPCTHPGAGKFCPECGRSMQVPPRYSLDEFIGAPSDTWLKKGFRRTFFGLFHRPGPAIRTFLFQDRDYLIKPVAYLIVAVAVNIWASSLFDAGETCAPDDGFCRMWQEEGPTIQMMQVAFFALLYRVAFRKAGLNLWEYGVGFCYIVAQAFLLDAILTLLFGAVAPDWRDLGSFLGYSIYMIAATVQLLQIRGPLHITGAVLVGVLAMAVYVVVVAILSIGWMEPSDGPATPDASAAPAIAAPPA